MPKISAHREAQAFTKTSKSNMEHLFDVAVKAAPLVPAAVLAGHVGSEVAKKVMLAANKGRAYRAMLAENPGLQRGDSKDSMKYFNTLYRMNPELAQDPVVAASFVSNQINMANPSAPHAGMYEAAMRMQGSRRGEGTPWGSLAMNAVSGLSSIKPPVQEMPFTLKEYSAMKPEHKQELQEYLVAKRNFRGAMNPGER